jgi:hypothetical protein
LKQQLASGDSIAIEECCWRAVNWCQFVTMGSFGSPTTFAHCYRLEPMIHLNCRIATWRAAWACRMSCSPRIRPGTGLPTARSHLRQRLPFSPAATFRGGFALQFYDPLRMNATDLGRPLARDLTAPIAYAASQESDAWLDSFYGLVPMTRSTGCTCVNRFSQEKFQSCLCMGWRPIRSLGHNLRTICVQNLQYSIDISFGAFVTTQAIHFYRARRGFASSLQSCVKRTIH